jgi:hypothetical protein
LTTPAEQVLQTKAAQSTCRHTRPTGQRGWPNKPVHNTYVCIWAVVEGWHEGAHHGQGLVPPYGLEPEYLHLLINLNFSNQGAKGTPHTHVVKYE